MATAEVVPPGRTYGGRFDGTEDCKGSCIGSTRWRMESPGWDPFTGWMIVNVSFFVIFVGLFMFIRFLDRHHKGWKGMFYFPHNFSDYDGKNKFHWRKLDYEWTVWTIYFVLTSLAVADRFSYNIDRRQGYQIGIGDRLGNRDAGSDYLVGFKPGPWSVIVYDVLARVSGKVSITSLNLLLITRFHSLAHWMTWSWPRHIIDVTDLVNANLRLHRWNGLMVCIMMLAHVWSILFPAIFHGYKVEVIQGSFEYPFSERQPPELRSSNAETETVMMQIDDVWRLVIITLFLAILMPISVRWLARKWHLGIHFHNFIMMVYMIDIVRRHTHPHSWIYNFPVFVLYAFDKIWGTWWMGRCEPDIVSRTHLSNDYLVVTWAHPTGSSRNPAGPDYWLRVKGSSMWERSHPFTCFENRCGAAISAQHEKMPEWTVSAVIRIFRNKRRPALSKKETHSHTMSFYDAPEPLKVLAWGPTQGEMSEHIYNSLKSTGLGRNGCTCVVLVACGSGINYILDTLQSSLSDVNRPLLILYSTRDAVLLDWIENAVEKIVAASGVRAQVILAITTGAKPAVTVKVVDNDVEMPNISSEVSIDAEGSFEGTSEDMEDGSGDGKKKWQEDGKETYDMCGNPLANPMGTEDFHLAHSIKRSYGRIDFAKFIPEGSHVYCQGNKGLKDTVEAVCKLKESKYVGGNGGQ